MPEQLAVITMCHMKQRSTGWLYTEDTAYQKRLTSRVQKGARHGAMRILKMLCDTELCAKLQLVGSTLALPFASSASCSESASSKEKKSKLLPAEYSLRMKYLMIV